MITNLFLSIDESSIVMYKQNSDIDFKNIVNAIDKANQCFDNSDSCTPTWINTSFENRRNITLSSDEVRYVDIGWQTTFDRCQDETLVFKSDETPVVGVGYELSGGDCYVVFNGEISTLYWIYYNNTDANENHGEMLGLDSHGSPGAEQLYSLCQGGAGGNCIDMCSHLTTIYNSGNFEFNCTSIGSGPYNYTILLNSNSLYFSGNITTNESA